MSQRLYLVSSSTGLLEYGLVIFFFCGVIGVMVFFLRFMVLPLVQFL